MPQPDRLIKNGDRWIGIAPNREATLLFQITAVANPVAARPGVIGWELSMGHSDPVSGTFVRMEVTEQYTVGDAE
jgi:hypothetical protein